MTNNHDLHWNDSSPMRMISKIKCVRNFGFSLSKLGVQLKDDELAKSINSQMNIPSFKAYAVNRSIGLKESKDFVERLRDRCILPEQVSATKVLLIDDERNLEADTVARSYMEGVKQLETNGPWGTLLLDHDLASHDRDRERTGYDLISWLEEFPRFAPREIICVSANPVGRKRIEQVIRNIYRNRDS